LVSNEKFEGFKQSTREDLARFIYSSCKFPAKSLLLKLAQAKELIQLSNSEIPECEEVDEVDLNEEIEENEENEEIYEYEENLPISPYPTGPIIDLNQDVDNWEEPDCKAGFKSVTIEDLQSPDLLIQEFKGQIKPTCELLINYLQRDSLESLEYTQSESTGRVETSFRLSNTITGRFPRLSGSSLAVLETPSKEAKKSYTEYIECMESPRFSSKYQSPLKVISSTPVFSPKQAAYTIQEVKNFLIPENEGLNKLSPGEKENLRRSRNNHVKPLSFQDTDSKSLNSELCMSSREYFKPRTVFEEQKISCRCQSCGIF
jgi:rubredoxin